MDEEEEQETEKKPSALGGIIGIVVATLLAVAGGGGGGIYMAQTLAPSMEDTKSKKGGKKTANAEKTTKADSKDKNSKDGKEDGSEDTEAMSDPSARIALDPITTNLAAPDHSWIRLEVSVRPLKEGEQDRDELLKQIHEDILGFLRTLSLAQIQGPSGFQHMREDLNERVKIRSHGTIGQVLIHSLLVE